MNGWPDDDPNYGYEPQSQIAPGVPPAKEERREISNIEAEGALLGAIMMDNAIMDDIALRLSVDDFFEPLHARVYGAIQKLRDRGKGANPVTLRPMFETDQAMLELGGPSYLAKLTGSGVAVLGASDFADQVAELGARRRMIEAALTHIERLEEDYEATPTDIGASLEGELWAANARASVIKPKSAFAAVQTAREHIQQVQSGEKPIGILTKTVPELNGLIGAAVPGRYNVIGGRPGMGKSVLLQSACLGYALNGAPVEYYHAEMSEHDQHLRFVADLSLWLGRPIRHDDILHGKLSPVGWKHFEEVEQYAKQLPINFNCVGRTDVRALRGMVERASQKWRRAGKENVIVAVDYMQILNATLNGRAIDDPSRKVEQISTTLLDIAKDGHWALALSQVGRHVDDRKDKRPMISDLKLSSSLENDADSVGFVYREEYYLQKATRGIEEKDKEAHWIDLQASKGKAEFSLPKNRHGPEGSADLKFVGDYYAMRSKDHNPYAGAQAGLDLDPDDDL